ncbi:MAG: aminotransferase class I/II-fold pyridoxal phosphate-dependent enzyme [Catenulispora sp.]|nr:aminotransferase class I/II-fold pyridoxal phosphate-dependent enzyme [Catenulispora sp.]
MSLALTALTERQLRARSSLKWSRSAADETPMDIAEADFAVAGPIREALRAAVRESDLGYPDFDSPHGSPTRLAHQFVRRMSERHNVTVDVDTVEICAQVVQALCCALLAFTAPGDVVLLHAPAYPPMLSAIRSLGRVPLAVPMPVGSDDDVPDEARAVRVAMIVLCQPHNPTGRILETARLEALAEIAERNDAVIFCDEIHHDVTYDRPHLSIASCERARRRSVVFTSAAKSFNIAGLRCAVGSFGSRRLHEQFRRLPWHLRSGASVPGIIATYTAWAECDPWLLQFQKILHQNRKAIVAAFGQQCFGGGPDATYLAWITGNVSASGEFSFGGQAGQSPGKRPKIRLQPGSVYGTDFSGYFRINFATPPARLRRAISRLIEGSARAGAERNVHTSSKETTI